jgi:hypothetical protein
MVDKGETAAEMAGGKAGERRHALKHRAKWAGRKHEERRRSSVKSAGTRERSAAVRCVQILQLPPQNEKYFWTDHSNTRYRIFISYDIF